MKRKGLTDVTNLGERSPPRQVWKRPFCLYAGICKAHKRREMHFFNCIKSQAGQTRQDSKVTRYKHSRSLHRNPTMSTYFV